MKIIFLDIDGVLNTGKTFMDIYEEYQKTKQRRIEIDLERVGYLKEIVDKTNAYIVLSSTWRLKGQMVDGKFIPCSPKMQKLANIFAEYNLTIYDITPFIDGDREKEIYAYLEGRNVESFIIIDDEPSLIKSLCPYLIKTSTIKNDEMLINIDDTIGLCERNVEEAVNRLNKVRKL